MPPRYFALEVFLDKVLEGGAQVYVVTMEEFLLSALEKEADNLESLKKKKAIFKKIIPVYKQQLQYSCNPECKFYWTFYKAVLLKEEKERRSMK